MSETGISISCGVTTGTFMSEYFVRIPNSNQPIWEGTVDKEMVIDLKDTPVGEKYIDSRVYGYLVSVEDESVIVELPVEGNRRIRVPLNFVRKERVPV